MEIIAFIYLIRRDKALKATTHAHTALTENADLPLALNFRFLDFTPTRKNYVFHNTEHDAQSRLHYLQLHTCSLPKSVVFS